MFSKGLAVLPAFAIAAAIMLIAWWPRHRKATAGANPRWAAPIALGLGFLIAFTIVAGQRGWMLAERWHWLAPIVMAATVLGVIAGLMCQRAAPQWICAALAAVATAGLLHVPPGASHPLMWKLATGGLMFGAWICAETLAARRPGVSTPIAWSMIFAGLSIVLLESRLANFSLLAGSVAAMLGGIAVVALINRTVTLSRGGAIIIATFLSALSIQGLLYRAEDAVQWPCYVPIIAAPWSMWIAEIPAFKRMRPWQLVALRIALVVLTVGAAAAVAMKQGEAASSGF